MKSNQTWIKDLQNAINMYGEHIIVNQTQFFSFQQGTPVNIYTIKKAIPSEKGSRSKYIELYTCYSPIRAVLFLRDYLYILRGEELPIDNEKWNEERAKIEFFKEVK